ncbi:trehalose-6-phosphate synthase [Tateyamaria sp. ANG-S1]|uniref:alpha,alpha-trehalose-phosphate synthase (UDP-forming) n=1 Tax=Tateyamaria sp. ANG-S1 TaxID=1577905 RepID=UPI0005809B54|nr:trehalose-6-phosphate synthase [Tateyamaria sp. ANG-S1]KIC51885.1 glycosyl transferase family 20 [Tateyamaria sp. ANG-S1]
MTARLIVVSNRIPTEAEPSGGLVVALHDCLTAQGGVWIGTSGTPVKTPEPELRQIAEGAYTRMVFDISEDEHEGYYLGYANSVLWPLFHRRADLMHVQPEYADHYMAVNTRLADMLADFAQPDDLLWIHDYHFLPLAALLQERGVTCRIGFFLHIPFPVVSDILALPQANDLKDWVAAYDVFGVQTEGDVARVMAHYRDDPDATFDTQGRMVALEDGVAPRHFPIGIDAQDFAALALAQADAVPLAMTLGQKLVLGVDRLDYSKGLVHRFDGFAAYLEARAPDTPKATLLQIAPPSREDVDAYKDIRTELEQAAGMINGAHAELDWTPIRYIRRNVERDTLASVYRRADVAMVTPLADGMNLVAKEFVAAQDPDDPGVLILSHFAGAAEQLTDALMVNPYDAAEVGEAVQTALTMPLAERKARHARLLENVMTENIAWWTRSYLGALRGTG